MPGLILELEIRNEKYYVDKIFLNKKVKIKKPVKGKVVSRTEFDEIGSKVMGNFKKLN